MTLLLGVHLHLGTDEQAVSALAVQGPAGHVLCPSTLATASVTFLWRDGGSGHPHVRSQTGPDFVGDTDSGSSSVTGLEHDPLPAFQRTDEDVDRLSLSCPLYRGHDGAAVCRRFTPTPALCPAPPVTASSFPLQRVRAEGQAAQRDGAWPSHPLRPPVPAVQLQSM